MSIVLAVVLGMIAGYVLCLVVQRLTTRRSNKLARDLQGGMDLAEVSGAHAPVGSAGITGNPYGSAKSAGM